MEHNPNRNLLGSSIKCLFSTMALCLFLIDLGEAGDCRNHIRINKIDNVLIDGTAILVHATDWTKGAGFNITMLEPFHFRISSTANAEYKKFALSTLLTAQSTGQAVIFQLAHIDNYTGEIDKVAVANAPYGLDCTTF
jgi:hypothetical protein